MKRLLRLGTRGSKLALLQANRVKQQLIARNPFLTVELVVIHSEGDIDKETPLSELGGKGIFIRSLEKALVQSKIDIAVHSLKDVTTSLIEGTVLEAFLPVDSSCDAICLSDHLSGKSLLELPLNARIATGSLRRKLQLLHFRSDLIIVPIRGNLDTRLERLKTDNSIDGIMVSEAGLLRFNQHASIDISLDPLSFIPAPGQGVIVIQSRENDSEVVSLLQTINDTTQSAQSLLELAIVDQLGFDCQYPLGLYAQKGETEFLLHAFNAPPVNEGLQAKGRYDTFKVPLSYTTYDINRIAQSLVK